MKTFLDIAFWGWAIWMAWMIIKFFWNDLINPNAKKITVEIAIKAINHEIEQANLYEVLNSEEDRHFYIRGMIRAWRIDHRIGQRTEEQLYYHFFTPNYDSN